MGSNDSETCDIMGEMIFYLGMSTCVVGSRCRILKDAGIESFALLVEWVVGQ